MCKLFGAILLALTVSIPAISQVRRDKQSVRKPVIRTTASVNGSGAFKPEAVPDESSAGIWNSLELAEHKVMIDFPSKPGDVVRGIDAIDRDMGKIWSYSVVTRNANYRLMVRNAQRFLDPREAENALDDTIERIFGFSRIPIKSKRTVYYGGYVGREIMIEGKQGFQAARLFIVNGKLLALLVTGNPQAPSAAMEVWARRFFQSFALDLPARNYA